MDGGQIIRDGLPDRFLTVGQGEREVSVERAEHAPFDPRTGFRGEVAHLRPASGQYQLDRQSFVVSEPVDGGTQRLGVARTVHVAQGTGQIDQAPLRE